MTGSTDLPDLLAHPLLWRGQNGGSAAEAAIATGFDALDRYLPSGGWPLTGISEIFVERYGLGELRLLMPALATLSRRVVENRQWIVWIAPPFVPYAPALAYHGVDLSRILLVHPSSQKKPKKGSDLFLKRSDPKEADPKEALWAVEQVIRSQSSAAALAWVKTADVTALRRLQLGAEECRCWTVLFRPMVAISQSSPASLRLKLSPVAPAVAGASCGTRAGIHVEILKCRGRKPRRFLL